MTRYLMLPVSLFLLAGCGTPGIYAWQKEGAAKEELRADATNCREMAFAAYGANLPKMVDHYKSCMVSRGWRKDGAAKPAQG
ncbi:hypothetical protein SAMN06265795_11616 [Noviherbaspirillum humi]|uniref:Uncharacterized protein n=1 Tax=Noviherbaspirillum humi TaxID=1688639 RepID=A0A239KHX6_9BURK|nr:hypothetical protein [Noviherbaspirillum humi]SNT17967.1 hypothetical protein SAMN06265795_11616 [Noviherbaspirillum humi]